MKDEYENRIHNASDDGQSLESLDELIGAPEQAEAVTKPSEAAGLGSLDDLSDIYPESKQSERPEDTSSPAQSADLPEREGTEVSDLRRKEEPLGETEDKSETVPETSFPIKETPEEPSPEIFPERAETLAGSSETENPEPEENGDDLTAPGEENETFEESEEIPEEDPEEERSEKDADKVPDWKSGLFSAAVVLVVVALLCTLVYGLYRITSGKQENADNASVMQTIRRYVPESDAVVSFPESSSYAAMKKGKVCAFVLDTEGISEGVTARVLTVFYTDGTIREVVPLSLTGGFYEITSDFLEKTKDQIPILYSVTTDNVPDEAANRAVLAACNAWTSCQQSARSHGYEILPRQEQTSTEPIDPPVSTQPETTPGTTKSSGTGPSSSTEPTTQTSPISLSTDTTPASRREWDDPKVPVVIVATETVYSTETLPPETTEPETTDTETTEPETSEPETSEPDTTEPDTTEPDTTEPETTEPETTEPDATEPETTEPESSEPETTEPDTTEPMTTEPETSTEEDLPASDTSAESQNGEEI